MDREGSFLEPEVGGELESYSREKGPLSTAEVRCQMQMMLQKPRMRVCFDPEFEIPRLQKWFAENNHPSRQQVSNYQGVRERFHVDN